MIIIQVYCTIFDFIPAWNGKYYDKKLSRLTYQQKKTQNRIKRDENPLHILNGDRFSKNNNRVDLIFHFITEKPPR